jgi:hypothetical protein
MAHDTSTILRGRRRAADLRITRSSALFITNLLG